MASIHHTQHGDDARRLTLLRLSALGFAMLTGVIAFGYFVFLTVIGSSAQAIWSRDLRIILLALTLPALPGAVLSWWLLVVWPRHSSALAGGCAGLLTIVFAVLGVCMTGFASSVFLARTAAPMTLWQVIEATFTCWILGLVYICVQPWGWGMFLVGGTAGAAYGALVRRSRRLQKCW